MNIDIREMKLRILGEFDDTDLYDVFAVINAVTKPSRSMAGLTAFCAAVMELVANEVIVLGYEIRAFAPETVLNRDDSLDLVARLPDWFKLDQEKNIWTRSKGAFRVDPTPIMMLTDAGKEQALDIRKRYAFRWWEKTSSTDKL